MGAAAGIDRAWRRAMRFLGPLALLASTLLFAGAASADAPLPAAAAPLAAPPQAALPQYAPQQAYPAAQPYPSAPPYAPGYAPSYGAGVAPWPAPQPYWRQPTTAPRSPAMRNVGIGLFAAGGLATLIGAGLYAATSGGCALSEETVRPSSGTTSAANREHVGSARQALNGCDTSPILGFGVLVGGVLTAVAGIPLFVIGAKRVPVQAGTGNLAPTVRIGAGTASFRWTF